MSSLLSEAIVDAKALRESALKSAEASVIEKYSSEVRETVEKLLEQDELGGGLEDLGGGLGGDMGGDEPATADAAETPTPEIVEGVPLSAANDLAKEEGAGLSGSPASGETVEVEVDLGTLQEAVSALQSELEESQEFEFDAAELADMLAEADEDDDEDTEYGDSGASQAAASAAMTSASSTQDDRAMRGMEESKDKDGDGKVVPDWADKPGKKAPKWADQDDDDPEVGDALEEDLDELVDAIAERLTVDMGATLGGWAGRSSEAQKWEMEKALAHRRSTDMQDDLEVLRKAQEELVFENKQLKERISQYKQVVGELKEGLHDVNLSNARLLYSNRVLRNTSLNERQKTRIVEAISKAGSVVEARTIHETLESSVPSTPKRRPQSLSEAINRPSSIIRASRHEKTPSDPLSDRMKKLAGIK
jgi:hypothetical protein